MIFSYFKASPIIVLKCPPLLGQFFLFVNIFILKRTLSLTLQKYTFICFLSLLFFLQLKKLTKKPQLRKENSLQTVRFDFYCSLSFLSFILVFI